MRSIPQKMLVFVSLVLAACAPATDAPNHPDIAVDRSPVFVSAFVGTRQQVSLQVLNRGLKPLVISAVALEGVDGGSVPTELGAVRLSPELPATIAELDRGFVNLEYAPTGAGEHRANLVFTSNATDEERFVVEVVGTACDAAGADGGC